MTSNLIGINRYGFNRESVIKRRVPLCRGRYVILLFVTWTRNALPIFLFFNLSQINYWHLLQYPVQKARERIRDLTGTIHTRFKMVSLKRHLLDEDRDGVKNLRVTLWHISYQYLRRSLMWRYSTSTWACLIVTLMKHLWHPTATHSEDIRHWLNVIF